MWIYLRHYLNLVIIWSEFNEFKTVGPYVLDWAAEQYKCPLSHYISTALLASLQGLNLFWLFYILRIAYRFIFQDELEDERSDNDDNEFREEQRLDALARQGIDGIAGPKVLGNGQAATGNGMTTATEIRTNGMTNRKETVLGTWLELYLSAYHPSGVGGSAPISWCIGGGLLCLPWGSYDDGWLGGLSQSAGRERWYLLPYTIVRWLGERAYSRGGPKTNFIRSFQFLYYFNLNNMCNDHSWYFILPSNMCFQSY